MMNEKVVKLLGFFYIMYFIMAGFFFLAEFCIGYYMHLAGFEDSSFHLLSFILAFILFMSYFIMFIIARVTKVILSSIEEAKLQTSENRIKT